MTASFPTRPPLSTPPELQHPQARSVERRRLAAQPQLGLVGLLFAAPVFFALALGLGHVESSLLVLGPMSTFALPAVAMVAFWWNDWPGTRLSSPWSGLVDTLLVVGAAVVLTIAGQAVVERSDLTGVFTAFPAKDVPTTFPATLSLGGAAFAAMLQLSLVTEGWPLRRLGPLASGLAALAVSWGVACAAYFIFVNVNEVPAAARAAVGLRNPGGPIPAPDFGAALIAVGVWQAGIYIGLRGWPISGIGRRAWRLLTGNAVVIAGGAVTYLILRNLAGLAPETIGAACGCAITGVILVAMLFEGWPASKLSPGMGRLVTLGLSAAVAVALDRVLAAYADSVPWVKATPSDWVITAALSFIGAGVILHVGIGLRWPLALKKDSTEKESTTKDSTGKEPAERTARDSSVQPHRGQTR